MVLQQATVGLSKTATTGPPPPPPQLIKTEEDALSSGILVGPAGPIRRGGVAAHRGASGRNKRKGVRWWTYPLDHIVSERTKGRSSPPSAEADTDAASSSGNRSSQTIGRGRAKRARQAGDDDVVVLDADE